MKNSSDFLQQIEALSKEAELEHSGKTQQIASDSFEVQPYKGGTPAPNNIHEISSAPTPKTDTSNKKPSSQISNKQYKPRLGKTREPKTPELFDGKNPHEGHRNRKKKSADNDPDLSSFSDVEVLEYLLYNTIPRVDTNELAHLLIKNFGSLYGVLQAHVSELLAMPLIGEETARMLSSIMPAARRAEQSRHNINSAIKDIQSAVNFIIPYYINRTEENVYLTCLNNSDRVICMELVSRGSANSSHIDTQRIIEIACRHKATKVLLSHNHPSGNLRPSSEDYEITKRLIFSLLCAKVVLVDHIIVSHNGFYSFFANKDFDSMYELTDSVFSTNLVKESRANKFNYRKSLSLGVLKKEKR